MSRPGCSVPKQFTSSPVWGRRSHYPQLYPPPSPCPSGMETMFSHSHIKNRNMLLQPFLVIITLGIYGIYWFHVTLGELHRANNREEPQSWKWTILFCIPLLDFFSFWHYAGEYGEFVWDKYPRILIFILWLVFFPAVWFLVQRDLNRTASVQYIG